ncbi:MAG TPA: hypothetical protein VNW47_12075 [Terriglobales bacterium]|jgi:hypothetical protein|nr:hypothetical protein [Terriglobales bacterium]
MTILPQELCLHQARLTAAGGEWMVAVDSVMQTEDKANLLVNVILEQPLDEEHFTSRKLGLAVPASVILDPETCAEVIEQIQQWVDATEGDGFLDLVHHHN